MFIKLERRGTGLAVPTSIFNYMFQNRISYAYNFKKGGIEVGEDILNAPESILRGVLDKSGINYHSEDEKGNKRQNMKSEKKIGRLF